MPPVPFLPPLYRRCEEAKVLSMSLRCHREVPRIDGEVPYSVTVRLPRPCGARNEGAESTPTVGCHGRYRALAMTIVIVAKGDRIESCRPYGC
jgi:hypothetical protein